MQDDFTDFCSVLLHLGQSKLKFRFVRVAVRYDAVGFVVVKSSLQAFLLEDHRVEFVFKVSQEL